MGCFLCGVETVKCLVMVHLHCIISNLEIISKMSTLPPPGKISVDVHDHYSTVAFGNELMTF